MSTSARASQPTPHPALALAPEVAEALAAGWPVVALESTIISHGMPYPRNVEMAREVEQIVRDGGATPATIAVLDGVARIGLSADELELLATDEHVAKVSIRDLPHVMATQGHGATTVASTMRLAALAGIRVFVTGGLGGVQRSGRGMEWSVREAATECRRSRNRRRGRDRRPARATRRPEPLQPPVGLVARKGLRMCSRFHGPIFTRAGRAGPSERRSRRL